MSAVRSPASLRPAFAAFAATTLLLAASMRAGAAQVDIPGPAGSVQFGSAVLVLPNGNIVVTDPAGPSSNVGAVYVYSPGGALISTLTGSSANDRVGIDGVFAVGGGNFVVVSSLWNNGAGAQASGAVTWVNGTTGLTGVVSPANSLVGTTQTDFVGGDGITVLSNGNYVVRSLSWDNGATFNTGAVTWGSGSAGISGPISAGNSLVGTTAVDRAGSGAVIPLANGNYVVTSRQWDNGSFADAGAVTWGSGSSGVAGAISASNSLVGTLTNDRIGIAQALVNGHYVVSSPDWNSGTAEDVGAVTWCHGGSGCSGIVTPANSLIGLASLDNVGLQGIVALSNGHYVVLSSNWDNGAVANAGAVTWANGTATTSAVVSAANSLVGRVTNDSVGNRLATPLANGNYVVGSMVWDNGATADVGAITWCNGTGGCTGAVTPMNSLIGTTTGDRIGANGLFALSNSNYVVASPFWDRDGTLDVGAATWANGTTGLVGVVSIANSLVGDAADDLVSSGGVLALTNGNYVVTSPDWNNGFRFDAGAVTWGSGTAGVSGTPQFASLVGGSTNDRVGDFGARALTDGNYVVVSPEWNDNTVSDVGAITWANGGVPSMGGVDADNSLIGTSTGDRLGRQGVVPLAGGLYLVLSALWDNGSTQNAGAVTLARSAPGLVGIVTPANSVLGTVPGDVGRFAQVAYDVARQRLVIGRPLRNLVTLFTLPADLVFANGFE